MKCVLPIFMDTIDVNFLTQNILHNCDGNALCFFDIESQETFASRSVLMKHAMLDKLVKIVFVIDFV